MQKTHISNIYTKILFYQYFTYIAIAVKITIYTKNTYL